MNDIAQLLAIPSRGLVLIRSRRGFDLPDGRRKAVDYRDIENRAGELKHAILHAPGVEPAGDGGDAGQCSSVAHHDTFGLSSRLRCPEV